MPLGGGGWDSVTIWWREFSEGWSVKSTKDAAKERDGCSQCSALVLETRQWDQVGRNRDT